MTLFSIASLAVVVFVAEVTLASLFLVFLQQVSVGC